MCEVQESPKVTRADLKQRGVRPYDEKVSLPLAVLLAPPQPIRCPWDPEDSG